MKLQLDSGAMAWLWENGGPEFKLELQNAVVQEFTRRYLKALVNDDMIQAAKADIENRIRLAHKEIEKRIAASLGEVSTGYNGDFKLVKIHEEAQNVIRQVAIEQREAGVAAILKVWGVDSYIAADSMERRVNLAIEKLVRDKYDEEVTRQVRAQVRARLAETLA